MTSLDMILFVALPYVAAFVFVIGVANRYLKAGFQVSSLSSQFLEGKSLFWGAVPFHIGLLVVLGGHLLTFLFPGWTLAWNSDPVRLMALEVTAFVFGLSALVGLVVLMVRRFTNPRVKAVTTKMDIAIEALLLAQFVFGCWIALGYRWGSSWFAADLTPYLRSLAVFSPDPKAVVALPWVIKVHIVGAFLIVLMVPFTRLVHFVVAPLHYITRSYQRVIWNWDNKTVRDPATSWSDARPKNN